MFKDELLAVDLSKEHRLIGAIIASDWSMGRTRTWDGALFDGIDWLKIPNLAWQYKIRPMMAAAMREAGWPGVPAEIRSAVEKAERDCSVKSMHQLQLLGQLAAEANSRGLRFFVLKGIALSLHLYQDPFIREQYDLDFLVHPEDIPSFDELLLAAGCRPEQRGPELTAKQERILGRFQHHRRFYQSDVGVVVERHHVLDQNTNMIRTDFDALWTARERLNVGKEPVFILGNADLIHFLGIHGSRHCWERWKWIGDLAMLLRKMDGAGLAQVRERVQQSGNHNSFDSWLLLVSWIAGWPSPPTPVMSAARNFHARILAQMAIRISSKWRKPGDSLGRSYSLISAFYEVLQKKTWRNAGFVILSALHRDVDWRALRFPDRLTWVNYLMRPVFLVKRIVTKKKACPAGNPPG